MSLNYRNQNNLISFKINSGFFSFLTFSFILLIFYLIINIGNSNKIIKRDKIPALSKQIEITRDQIVISINNKDKLIRNHIKNEAEKAGMIRANYSTNIIKW